MNASMKKYVKAVLNLLLALIILILTVWLLPKVIIFFMRHGRVMMPDWMRLPLSVEKEL